MIKNETTPLEARVLALVTETIPLDDLYRVCEWPEAQGGLGLKPKVARAVVAGLLCGPLRSWEGAGRRWVAPGVGSTPAPERTQTTPPRFRPPNPSPEHAGPVYDPEAREGDAWR